MKASLLNKLDILQDRFEELTALLGDAEVISDQTRFRAYSREYAEVEPVIATYRQFLKTQSDLEGAQALLKDSDPDVREMAEEEVIEARGLLEDIETRLQRMLLPKDPKDGRNVFLEIRAGTGGDEAAIFSGDLFRMYSRYAERQGWRVEILSESPGEHGGYKEVISRVEGETFSRSSSSSLAPTESSAFRKPNPRGVSIPPPVPSPCCLSRTSRSPSRSTRPICASTPTGHPVLVVSTSTRPTRLCVSLTFPAVSSWSVRRSVRSTRTAPGRWPGLRPNCRTCRTALPTRKSPTRASCWSVPVTVPSAFVPTTFRRGASRITVST